MFKRILKFLLGIATLPICIAASLSLYEQFTRISSISYDNQKYFIIGAVAYLVVHAVFFKPAYLYILGHELMHVVATIISGGKITSFRVSPQGGSVRTTKSNIFIALAPYLFPFYTMIATAAFLIVLIVTKSLAPYGPFLFIIGFTLAFHIILTIDFLKIRQTDLLHAGYLFSICLIYIANLIVIGFIFSLLFKELIFIDFSKDIYFRAKDIYAGIVRQLFL